MNSLPSIPARRAAGLSLAGAILAVSAFAGAPALASPVDQRIDKSAQAAAAELYKPKIVDGQAQPTLDPADVTKSEVWIKTNVDTDNDGKPDEIYATLSVPNVAKDGVTVPTVIAASPYYGGLKAVPQHNPKRELWDPSQPKPEPTFGDWNRPGDSDSGYSRPGGKDWLSRGYAFMTVATVGTDQSSGCPQMLNRDEAEANKSVIQWLTGKGGVTARNADGDPVTATEWSAGKVGMTGTSYDGALPLLTATTGVEGLEVISPMAPVSNFYDYYRVGGGNYGPEGYQGEDLDNYVQALLTTDASKARCTATAKEFNEKQDRASGDYSDFWDERNMLNWADNVKAATLIGHGQADLNVRTKQSTDWYQTMKAQGTPTKLYLHQYSHISLNSLPPEAGWNRDQQRWFTQYLFDADNGAEKDSGVRIQAEDETWFDDTNFPNSDSGDVKLFPTTGGDGVGGLEQKVRSGAVETRTFADDSAISLQDLVDSEDSKNRLLYRSEPLKSELRLNGTASAKLQVAINRPAANVTMAIADRAPDGKTHIISRAWTDPQNRTDDRTTEAVEPDKSYGLDLNFVPVDYRVKAGHSLVLLLASSDTDTSLLPPTPTELSVDTSATEVSLPVVGAQKSADEAFGEPAEPQLKAGSTSIVEGEEQTITGTGLAPNTDFELGVGDGAGSQSARAEDAAPVKVRTDDRGEFTATLPADAMTVGTNKVTLLAGRATIATTEFEVTKKDTPTPEPTPTDSDNDTDGTPGGSDSDANQNSGAQSNGASDGKNGAGASSDRGANGSGDLPRTGGEVGLPLLAGLLLVGGGAIITAITMKRRRNV